MGEETHNLLSIGRLQAPIDNPLIQLILLIPSNNSPLLNQFFHIILNSTRPPAAVIPPTPPEADRASFVQYPVLTNDSAEKPTRHRSQLS